MATAKTKQAEKVIAISKQEGIYIKGARVHNLKNISVTIPRNKLIVVTGVQENHLLL
jgi:excinuclease ABC subunit A